MKVQVNKDVFDVRFYYDTNHVHTRAILIDSNSGISYVGVTEKSEKDQYKKKIGRKIALLRAMREAGLEKDARTKIWFELQQKGMKLA